MRWAETTLSEALSPAGPVYLQRHSRAIVSKATPVLPISGILLFCESVRSVGAGQRRVSWVMRCARARVCVCVEAACACAPCVGRMLQPNKTTPQHSRLPRAPPLRAGRLGRWTPAKSFGEC